MHNFNLNSIKKVALFKLVNTENLLKVVGLETLWRVVNVVPQLLFLK
jgi:hypothetical protein